jgi:coenzyme F420-reducing hydrogenase delta subunit
MLELLGIDDRRLRLKWISASEGAAFAEEIRLFVELLTELGENPLESHGDEPSDLQTIGP